MMRSSAAAPAFLVALALLVSACVDEPEGITEPIDLQAAKGASSCATRTNDNVQKLTECVTLGGVQAHLAALSDIATANGTHRPSGTSGYDASAAYVEDLLSAAGYRVTVQEFQFQGFVEQTPTVLERVAPAPTGAISNMVFAYSGSGDVTAPTTALPPSPADPTPGCEAADYAGFPAGNIALIQRGACTFAIKATNAYSAGASGLVIYNNQAGEINGTLGNDFGLAIPVVSVTQEVGTELAATPGLILRIKVDATSGTFSTSNVIAETMAGDPGNVVVVGAHLDSSEGSPGINDNGSGVAALLETALRMAGAKPRNQVRFAFWGGYEQGRLGSQYYLDQLGEAGRNGIALYIEAHMLASPNYALFVVDRDATIADLFRGFYTWRGFPSENIDLGPGFDATDFASYQIPVGGITAGAEGIKTAEQAATFGGTAGIAFDPCYHQSCDGLSNVSLNALDLNSDAIATATITFAMNTEALNGVKGKGKPPKPAVTSPTGLATR